jgi:hypothetical protein
MNLKQNAKLKVPEYGPRRSRVESRPLRFGASAGQGRTLRVSAGTAAAIDSTYHLRVVTIGGLGSDAG